MTDATETTAQQTEPEAPAHIHIFEALAAAQAEFLPVKKTATGNYGKYATLDEILSATRPALNRHGLYLFQRVEAAQGGLTVETVIAYKTGETLSSGKLYMPSLPVKGGNAAQAMGSARTYACRYSLASLLGIAADDDDDGKGAGDKGNYADPPPQDPPLQKQATRRPPQKQKQPPATTQPPEPILTNETVEEGKLAAESGMAGYQAFWNHQTAAIRKLLISSGWHDALKAQAAAADASNNGGQAA